MGPRPPVAVGALDQGSVSSCQPKTGLITVHNLPYVQAALRAALTTDQWVNEASLVALLEPEGFGVRDVRDAAHALAKAGVVEGRMNRCGTRRRKVRKYRLRS